jgi:hypothetical protein
VVDWPEDLRVVREIYASLAPAHGPGFGVDAIVELYRKRPELERWNARHVGYHYAQTRAVTASAVPASPRNGETRSW